MTDKPQITQAMINAYDEYAHRSLDRRGFMEKLTVLAGSAAAAAIIAPMLAGNAAHAAIVADDDARITTATVSYGDKMTGYLVRPATISAALPSVIVIHENRGLTPHIKDVARRMALEGFVALAPDFLAPAGGTPTDEDAARKMIGELDMVKTVQNAVDTVDYLEAQNFTQKATGVVGFCWGGGMSNRLAAASPKLKAAVPYYGPQVPAESVPGIKAALLLQYAESDDWVNKGIEDYRKALEANGKTFEIHIYEGAQHAFNNDTSEARYNKAAADLAWSRTVAWFKKYLV